MMREAIAIWGDHLGMLAMAVAFIAWTVTACAKGEAVRAAIYSPLALVVLVTAIIGLALHFGWFGGR